MNENEFSNGTIGTHNGQITVTNTATGDHRTFMIRTQPDDARFAPGRRIVSLFTGGDNDNPFDYTGFGFVNDDGTIRVWRKKSGGVFDTYAKMLSAPESFMARGVVYEFAGRCRICNRTLTNPASIRSGIGPVCAERAGVVVELELTVESADEPFGPNDIGLRAPTDAYMVADAPTDLRDSPAFWRLFG